MTTSITPDNADAVLRIASMFSHVAKNFYILTAAHVQPPPALWTESLLLSQPQPQPQPFVFSARCEHGQNINTCVTIAPDALDVHVAMDACDSILSYCAKTHVPETLRRWLGTVTGYELINVTGEKAQTMFTWRCRAHGMTCQTRIPGVEYDGFSRVANSFHVADIRELLTDAANACHESHVRRPPSTHRPVKSVVEMLSRSFPLLVMTPSSCPLCPVPTTNNSVSEIIVHLNDVHFASREYVADWLEHAHPDCIVPNPPTPTHT